jgi:methenyltetrahydromethanopterin cyclohydrolase
MPELCLPNRFGGQPGANNATQQSESITNRITVAPASVMVRQAPTAALAGAVIQRFQI